MKNKTVKMLVGFVTLGVLCGAYVGVKNYTAKQEEQDETEHEETVAVSEADSEKVNSIMFVIGGKEEAFSKEDGVWKKTDEEDFPVNQTALEDAAESLSGIEADRVLNDVDDLSEYGLDDPDNTITIGQEDETDIIIHVGLLNDSTSQYYINKEDDENTVYVVASGEIESFMNVQSVYDYAEKEEFPEVEADSITEIKVEKEDSYTMEEDSDTGFWYISGNVGDEKYESEKADSAQASTLTSTVSGLEFSDMVDYNSDDDAQYGFDDPYAVVTIDYEEEETETDGTGTDGTGTDGTETDGTGTDGTGTDGTETDGTETDGTETDGTETDETETDGTVESLDSEADSESEETNSSEDEIESDTVDEEVSGEEDSVEEESDEEDTVEEDTIEEESDEEDTVEEDTIEEDTVEEDSVEVNSNEVDSSEANSDEEDNSKETDSDAGEDESEEPEMIQKQLVIYIGDQTSSSARYVKVNDSDQVYTIADDSLSAIIEKTVPDFWDLTVNSVSLNDLESLDIDAEDGKHTVNVSRETSEDEDGETIESVSYLVDDKTIEDTLFTTFYNKLVNMAGQSRLTEEYDPDEASVMKIVSHKTNGEVVETNFYEYDSSFYTAVVEDRIYLVNKMTVKELLTAYDDMIDSVGEISEESEAINNTDTDKIPDETPDGGDNTDEVITEDTSVAEEDINEDINTGEKSAEEDS